MGKSSVTAVVAVFLAVVTMALWLAAESPTSTFQPDPNLEQRGLPGVQARRHTLRGQAWAMELFGRRYGRDLLA
jgi:hypothetical protein